MQEAEVAGAAKTFGQDVLQDQAQECHAAHAALFDPSGLAVPVAERHPAIVVGQDIFLPDHAPVQVTPEVNQRLMACADLLAIGHPLGGIGIRQFQTRLFDARQHLGAEHFRQRLVAEQVTPFLAAPPPQLIVERGGGHHQMHVRVIVEPAAVGVQHRHRASGAAQFPVVLAEGVDGLPRAAGDQVVHHALMPPGQRAELRGQGEGHHEVIAGHPLLQLLVYPVLRLVRLTVRARSVPAGMGQITLLGAVIAGKLHPGAHAAAA